MTGEGSRATNVYVTHDKSTPSRQVSPNKCAKRRVLLRTHRDPVLEMSVCSPNASIGDAGELGHIRFERGQVIDREVADMSMAGCSRQHGHQFD